MSGDQIWWESDKRCFSADYTNWRLEFVERWRKGAGV